jgi:hypothetical protein
MINLPFVSLPDHYTLLLCANIQNATNTNSNLEIYFNEHRELNMLVKRLFLDIDKEGFFGRILSISGWAGIRNRLAAAYIEYAITGKFPEVANLSLVNDLVILENKLRHFTSGGYSRAFLLAFYSKMSQIHLQKISNIEDYSPLIIKDEHLEYLKYSKSKSVRIDWLIFQLVQFDYFFGKERMNSLLKTGTTYDALFNLLMVNEQKIMIENCFSYGASIGDKEFFLNNSVQ